MKSLSAKQEARLEKKKKKMAALTEIIKLNDRDGRKKTGGSLSDATNSGDDEQTTSAASSSSHNQGDSVSQQPKRPLSTDVDESATDRRPHKDGDSNSHRPAHPYEPIANKRLKRAAADASQSPTPTSAATSTTSTSAVTHQQQQQQPPIGQLDYAAMRQSLIARKRTERAVPKIRLKLMGDLAALTNAAADRTPIFLTDVQHLVMGAVLGSGSPCSPYRWCHIERCAKVSHVVVLVVDGCSLADYTEHADTAFAFAGGCKLPHKLEVVMPADGHVVEELVQVPLTDGQSAELIERYGSLEAAVESTRNQMLLVNTVFPVAASAAAAAAPAPPAAESTKPVDSSEEPPAAAAAAVEVVPRTQLLLSALQLVDEGYPIPLSGELANRYRDYVMTQDRYAPVHARSPMFGLDCEMCRTSAGINELTRISIVDEQYRSVYETLVRPDNKIIDYLTQYSGITGAMMLNVTKTRAQVQQDVRRLLPPDAILVGQSLQSDLVAMQMMHPYVIDTSCIFNLCSERRIKSKLQKLSQEFLGELIQDNPLGHDSIEDCSASLKLTQLKLARGVDFGDAILLARRRANEVRKRELNAGGAGGEPERAAPAPTAVGSGETEQRSSADANIGLALPAAKRRKSTLVIAAAETGVDYAEFVRAVGGGVTAAAAADKHIRCERADSNKAAVRLAREQAIQHDLTICHVRVGGRNKSDEHAAQLARVDRWIGKCWEAVAANGLLIVLMGRGQPTVANNGADDGASEPAAEAAATSAAAAPPSSHSGVVLFGLKPAAGANVEYRK